jgi:hypothetical protein
MKKFTVISHVYNEEYMLPWWLNHHKDIADHGIIIDYHSTDRSIEIIKDICPTWTIVKSRNEKFQADLVDQEVMDLESEISGFKLCLNVTEFFMPKEDLNSLFSQTDKKTYRVRRALIVDENEKETVSHDEKLTDKKHYGFIGDDPLHTNFRYLHNHTRGNYEVGRHQCYLPNIEDSPSLIYWYGWAPWSDEFIARKSQIKNKIPDSDRIMGKGFHHFWNYEQMLNTKNYFLAKASYIN